MLHTHLHAFGYVGMYGVGRYAAHTCIWLCMYVWGRGVCCTHTYMYVIMYVFMYRYAPAVLAWSCFCTQCARVLACERAERLVEVGME